MCFVCIGICGPALRRPRGWRTKEEGGTPQYPEAAPWVGPSPRCGSVKAPKKRGHLRQISKFHAHPRTLGYSRGGTSSSDERVCKFCVSLWDRAVPYVPSANTYPQQVKLNTSERHLPCRASHFRKRIRNSGHGEHYVALRLYEKADHQARCQAAIPAHVRISCVSCSWLLRSTSPVVSGCPPRCLAAVFLKSLQFFL